MSSLTVKSSTSSNELATIETQEKVKELIFNSISANTRKAYKQWINLFTTKYPLPANESQVIEFIINLKKKEGTDYSTQSISQCLSAIRKAHDLLGVKDNPADSKTLKQVVKGLKRSMGSQVTRQAAPVEKENLLTSVVKLGTRLIDIRDKAIVLLGFAGAFRRSELANLAVSDLSFNEPGLTISLKRSKTNQEGRAEVKTIPYQKGKFCPVKAVQKWLETAKIESGRVFRSINRHSQLSNSITPDAIGLVIKKVCHESVELSGVLKVSGHSLRVGFITTCANSSIPAHQIQSVTGHKTPAMIAHYSRVVNSFASYPKI